MDTVFFIAIFLFIFGAFIGSFLNVVALRFGKEISALSGRSFCPVCTSTLSWYELLPILSFIFQKGQCYSCGAKISIRYPLVEILTGLVFASIYVRDLEVWYTALNLEFLLILLFHLTVFSILLVILLIDFKHKIIPDSLVFSFAALSLLSLGAGYFWHSRPFDLHFYLDLLSGPLLFFPIFLLWFFSGGRWIGLGDGKLALGLGWFLGFVGGISAFVLSFWLGAGVSLSLLGLKFFFERFSPSLAKMPEIRLKTEIPFGPFIILAIFLIFLFGWDVVGIGELVLLL